MKQQFERKEIVQVRLQEDHAQDAVDEEIDRLRQQKEFEYRLKQEHQQIQMHNRKQELQRQQIIKEVLPKSKDLKIAYDYDGTYMISKTIQNAHPIRRQTDLYAVNTVNTVFQPQKPVPQKALDAKPHRAAELKGQQPQSTQREQHQRSQESLELHQPAKPFEDFNPNNGVRLTYTDKQGGEVVKQNEQMRWGNGERMTRKQFESLRQQSEPQQNNLKVEMKKQLEERGPPKREQRNGKGKQNLMESCEDGANLRPFEMQQTQQYSASQTQQKRGGSKINVVDQALLSQLLS